ncbi:MAG: type II CAAX endopeptidase family protein [bacterium]|nr:type II CAAX endopeptidase family protein [bacterium]
MKIFQFLFGKDQSKLFFQSITPISIRQLIWKTCIIYFSFVLILSIGMVIVSLLTPNINYEQHYGLLVYIFPAANIVALVLSIRLLFKQNILKQQLTSLPIRTVIFHIGILGLFLFSLSILFSFATMIMNPELIQTTLEEFSTAEESTFPNLISVLLLAIFITSTTGFWEEIFFRGGIYRVLRGRYTKAISIVVSGIIFSLVHPLSILNFLYMMIFCSILSIYYEYKNNILTIAVLHTLNDLIFAGLSSLIAANIAEYILLTSR